jgi:hypothetical protein
MSEISSSPSQSFDPASGLMEVYECAKNCNNWNKILSSLIIHPEWLIKYLDGLKIKVSNRIEFLFSRSFMDNITSNRLFW